MSQSDMMFIYISRLLEVVRLCMCFCILICAFQSGGLADIWTGEKCVFFGGMEANAAALRE